MAETGEMQYYMKKHLTQEQNPAADGRPGRKEVELSPKWLDKRQRATFLRAVNKEVENANRRYPRLRLMVLRDAAIVRLILFAGLRVGEIVQLRLNDMTLDERKGSLVVREGKGTKRREIPLNSRVQKVMVEYLQVRPDIESNNLFLGQRGEGIQSKTVQRAVQRFSGESGLENVTPHVLRHSFAKASIDSGVTLEKVATLLGHSNLNTTRTRESSLIEGIDVGL